MRHCEEPCDEARGRTASSAGLLRSARNDEHKGENTMKKFALVLIACIAAWPLAAAADDYPNQPIKMIVPISVGSITDVASRLAAQELQAKLGQPVVVINKPGAAMVLGGSECAKSDPDGYTLCVVSPDTMSFNPLTIPDLPYNPEQLHPDHRHVSRGRRADVARRSAHQHHRGSAHQGSGRTRQAELGHARRAHHHRCVPAVAGRTLEYEIRRHPFQGRQRDHRRAARATPSTAPRSGWATWSAS